jgi:hypothetical protein
MGGKWPAFAVRSILAFSRTSPKLSAEVGERLCQRATGGSSRSMVHGLFSGTKPAYVDPGFASDRDRFRLEWKGEFLLCVAVERKTHLLMSSAPIGYLTAKPFSWPFPDSRSEAVLGAQGVPWN